MAGQLIGCHTPKTEHYLGDAALNYYKASATEIAYPNVDSEPDPRVQFSDRPATVRDPSTAEAWDLSLFDALQLALNNSKVLKARGSFRSPGNPLWSNPDRIASTYDAAIQDTGASFLQRGPEAALAAFDTQFTTSLSMGHNENIQNNILLGGGIGLGGVLTSDSGKFKSALQKTFANGGLFEVSQNWNYLSTNQGFQLYKSSYNGFVRTDYRQPLLAGAGTEYTRINGPITQTLPGMVLSGGGVAIARINTDITIADFEYNVTNMVRDVEDLYWELYLAYRTYDAEKDSRNAALNVWERAKRRLDGGRGSVVDEAQARENYFASRIRLENAVATLYSNEGQLRRMLGLPVNDGKILRPSEEPLVAEYRADWRMALTESLIRRVELRRQKWSIKSLELQVTAAESLIKPRLDFTGGYQFNGFGRNLIAYDPNDGFSNSGLNSAFTTLTRGNQASWDLGLEFSLPVGLRSALTNKRNLELRLSKARATLATQELEISHELSAAVQLMDWWYQIAQTSLYRQHAAEEQVSAAEREYDAGRIPVDLLLSSQANLSAAKVGRFNALVKYNQAITDLRVRKGTLLEENNIHLAEGGWTPQAYNEALRRAWARSYAIQNNQVETEPAEFASPVPPAVGMPEMGSPVETSPDGVPPVPASAPEESPATMRPRFPLPSMPPAIRDAKYSPSEEEQLQQPEQP